MRFFAAATAARPCAALPTEVPLPRSELGGAGSGSLVGSGSGLRVGVGSGVGVRVGVGSGVGVRVG